MGPLVSEGAWDALPRWARERGTVLGVPRGLRVGTWSPLRCMESVPHEQGPTRRESTLSPHSGLLCPWFLVWPRRCPISAQPHWNPHPPPGPPTLLLVGMPGGREKSSG